MILGSNLHPPPGNEYFLAVPPLNKCGENCTGMRAMPVGKLSKTGKIKECYQNIYGQMSINVENP